MMDAPVSQLAGYQSQTHELARCKALVVVGMLAWLVVLLFQPTGQPVQLAILFIDCWRVRVHRRRGMISHRFRTRRAVHRIPQFTSASRSLS